MPRDLFMQWLIDNYGFHPGMVPIRHMPPMFLTRDGTFDVAACEKWTEGKRREWLRRQHAATD